MKQDWFAQARHHLHLDCHLPGWPVGALEAFDAEAWASEFARAHIGLVSLFAKCHFGNAYYYTRYGNRHPGLPCDMLGELIEACHRRGIKVTAYYSLCTDYRAYLENPAWRAKRADGSDLDEMALFGGKLCPNTPYREDLVLPQIEELVRHYQPDGFFIDIPLSSNDYSGCYCDFCRRKFKAQYGQELTLQLPAQVRHDFVEQATIRTLEEIVRLRDAYLPGAYVASNRSWRPETSRHWASLCDYGVMECQPREHSYQMFTLRLRHARTLPVTTQVMTVRFFEGWGDLTLKPVEQQKYEYGLMVAFDGIVSSGDQVGVDGTLQSAAYDAFQESLEFVSQREPFAQAQHARHGALLIGNTPPETHAGTRGAETALSESQRQFDLLQDTDLDQLDRYRFAVLADRDDLSAEDGRRVQEWVRQGGKLLVSGQAGGLCGDFMLGELLGVTFVERSAYSLGHLDPANSLLQGLPNLPLQITRPLLLIKPDTAEALMGWRMPAAEPSPPHRTFRHRYPPAGERSPYPAITRQRFGQGEVVYVATELFSEYHQTNHAWVRQVIDKLMEIIDPEPPFWLSGAPRMLRANLMQRPGEWLLHMVNHAANTEGGGHYAAIEYVPPIAGVAVNVRAQVRSAVLQPAGQALSVRQDGAVAHIAIPLLGLYDVLQLELAE